MEASDLDDLLAAPIHIRWEIVRLAEMQAQGASIDARFPFISAAVANRKSNLAQAAEHLRKHERVAGDTHLLDNAPPTGKTVEYIEAFINGTGSDTDMLYRFVDDPVTDHDAGTTSASGIMTGLSRVQRDCTPPVCPVVFAQ